MKDYKQVVKERFDEEAEDTPSMYDADQPIGRYTRLKLFKELSNFLKDYTKSNGDLSDKKLLDVGCGSGGMLSYFHSNGFDNKHLTGIDLSQGRIEKAKKTYPELRFLAQDAVSLNPEEKYDVITTFDLLSHISTEAEILKILGNLKGLLQKDGTFLWYDIFSKDHYDSPANADSWGFSAEQMKDLAAKAGFKVEKQVPIFKLFFNKYHSVYQARRVSPKMLSVLEKVIPGSPGNLMMVFSKK